jgi:hypothetical protein
MCSLQYFFNIFRSAKILPSSQTYDSNKSQETLSTKQDSKLKQLSLVAPFNLEHDIPSPCILPTLTSSKKNNITSFYSSYDYATLYNFIYTILLPYDPYFDQYEIYWLITDKRYRIHTSIKISLYQANNNEIIVECCSMDKDDKFWKIYHLLKKKCNNVKDKLMGAGEKELFQQEFFII